MRFKITYLRYIYIGIFLTIGNLYALGNSSSATYYGKVTAQVGTGQGKVYVAASQQSSISESSYLFKSEATGNASSTSSSENISFYLYAKPSGDYKFKNWVTKDVNGNETIKSTENPYSYSLSASSKTEDSPTQATLYANFFTTMVTVNSASPSICTVKIDKEENNIGDNVKISATITDNNNYEFSGWALNGEIVSTSREYSFQITEDNTGVYWASIKRKSLPDTYYRFRNSETGNFLDVFNDYFSYRALVSSGSVLYGAITQKNGIYVLKDDATDKEKNAYNNIFTQAQNQLQRDMRMVNSSTAITRPGSIIQTKFQSGVKHNLLTQGTSFYDITTGPFHYNGVLGVSRADLTGLYVNLPDYNDTQKQTNVSLTLEMAITSGTKMNLGNVYFYESAGKFCITKGPNDTTEPQKWDLVPFDEDFTTKQNYFSVEKSKCIEDADGHYYTVIREPFNVKYDKSKVAAYAITGTTNGAANLQKITSSVISKGQCALLEWKKTDDLILLPTFMPTDVLTENLLANTTEAMLGTEMYSTVSENVSYQHKSYYMKPAAVSETEKYLALTKLSDGTIGFGGEAVTAPDGNMGYLKVDENVTEVALHPRPGYMYIEPASGTYDSEVTVTLAENTEKATIYYTTDGTDPKTSATRKVYTEPFTVSETCTVKTAGGIHGVYTDVAEATYTFATIQEMTLAQLVSEGEKDSNYAITDELTAVYENEEFIIAKDNNGAAQQLKGDAEQVDCMGSEFLGQRSKFADAADYDHSNWVRLDKAQLGTDRLCGTQSLASGYRGTRLTDVRGRYTDAINPTLLLTSRPTAGEEAAYTVRPIDTTGTDADVSREDDVNTFVAASFGGTQASEADGKTYFFVQPRPWEMGEITWSAWDGARFAAPTPSADGTVNGKRLQGGFGIDQRYNEGGEQSLEAGRGYVFHGLVTKAAQSAGTQAARRAQAAGDWLVYPLDLSESIVTGVVAVTAQAGVQSVRYVNVAGQVSATPWSGVNIVVTRHTDGTVTTTKAIR
ncbi:MAG: chitobiase/beta-hexosaminidase C-terminal domain-containing protein [Muribaculaceae bacterium]|nr:chitobiase/beta-hexosaminidase C-terminal domain-containing protein [Muribaculaceae bacterium]